MTQREACKACGSMILIATAEKNEGLCVPCKRGYRKDIEASKVRYQAEKKARGLPDRKHWVWLVNEACKIPNGFDGLTSENQLYFAACLVEGEVYNGGFDQYFHNSAADHYAYALKGLIEIGATESCRLLIQAKNILFGSHNVPNNQAARRSILNKLASSEAREAEISKRLDELDALFWKDTDNFKFKLAKFAEKYGLHNGF
ncbi:MAG: DMP19 family protein [Pseudomonas sp.]|uniref:DMP19 family protein n=1 Tax=Pseudomonas sp. TaxID=306 RepID=UPI003BB66D26